MRLLNNSSQMFQNKIIMLLTIVLHIAYETADKFYRDTMMMANRQLDPDVETVFLMADEEFAHVSSSLIKQITPLANDEMLGRFVPPEIIPALRQRIGGAGA